MEIERKWLLKGEVPVGMRELERCEVFQGYISTNPEVRVRLKSYSNGEETFRIAIKGDGDMSRNEVEASITEIEFNTLLEIGKIKKCQLIHKDYTVYEYGEYRLEVSRVDTGTLTEFNYVEIEFETEEEANNFVAPDWFGTEVTYDANYKMKSYWRMTRGI